MIGRKGAVNEVLIQQALWRLMEGRTALVVAHRLSTVARMDQLARNNGLPAARLSVIGGMLKQAESAAGTTRVNTLRDLASQLEADASSSSDAARVKALADVVRRIK